MCTNTATTGVEKPIPKHGSTAVYHTDDGAPYVICNASESFVNPTSTKPRDPLEINEELNLDLGQSWITRHTTLGKLFLLIFRTLDILLVQWWEHIFFNIWNELVPIQFKRRITWTSWKIYLQLHKVVFGKSTGLHPSQSYEYHAMTTVMFPSQFLAWTPKRMRFFLSELYSSAPNDPPDQERVRVVKHNMENHLEIVPKEQAQFSTVSGWFIRCNKNNNNKESKGTIFWLYGGAYLAGDVRGNSAAADWMAQQTGMDVFLPSFRLAPEGNLFDVLWDVCLAYYWLRMELSRNKSGNKKPIYILGISSGGAIAVRLMQLIAHLSREESLGVPDYFIPLVSKLKMPTGGGILFNPYVDYEQLHDDEKKGSFKYYARHDLVVNEAVQEYGLPYLGPFIPSLNGESNQEARKQQSPIHISCKGLPPLFLLVSEHEAVYDQNVQLVNKARVDGVQVTVGVWKYMCHVWAMLHGFLPEGQLCMDHIVDWVKQRQEELKQ